MFQTGKKYFLLLLPFFIASCGNSSNSSSSCESTASSSSHLDHRPSAFNINCRTVAHRGYHVTTVENTLSSFIEAGKRNFYGIETDIYPTKDNIWICHHDSTIISNGISYNISDLTYEETQNLPLDNPYDIENSYVPLFSEYITTCKQYKKNAYVELKTNVNNEGLQELINYLQENEMINHTTFISFGLDNINRIKALEEQSSYGLKYELLLGSAGNALSYIEQGISISLQYATVTEEIVNEFNKNNLHVAVWTVDEETICKSLIEMGVYSITTDFMDCTDEFNSNW